MLKTMKKSQANYEKVSSLLHDTMKRILEEKEESEMSIAKETRFEMKNKATADEVMRKIDIHGKEDYYRLRKKWSYYIFASLA